MLNTFRMISMLEGVSFLLLLFVAMPAKYYLGYPQAVTIMGWAHGGLFMAYIFFALAAFQRYNWSDGFMARVMISSMVPFACFFLDKRLKEESLEVVLERS